MTKYFKYPFAYQGDNINIPDDLQPNGSVSYQQGWGYDYQRRLGNDPLAKPVPRQQTNQLYNDITSSIKQYQENGFFDFITPEVNGGEPFSYSMGACVRFDMSDTQDGSDIRNYSSKVRNNTGNPKDNPEDWSDLANIDINFATNEEAQAGTITDKVISPASLASVTATTNRRGLVQLADDAEAENGVNKTKALTPFGLVSAFSNNDLSENGYQILPGGLIIQWMKGSGMTQEGLVQRLTFPLTFPNSIFNIVCSHQINNFNVSSNQWLQIGQYTNSYCDVYLQAASVLAEITYPFIFVVGY